MKKSTESTDDIMEFVGKLSKLCHKYGVVIVSDKNYDAPLLVENTTTPHSRSKLTYMFSQFEPLPYEQKPKQIGLLEHIYMKMVTTEEYEKTQSKAKKQ